jgi:catalase
MRGRAMKSVPKAIKLLQISHFLKADKDYGKSVAEALGVAMADAVTAGKAAEATRQSGCRW